MVILERTQFLEHSVPLYLTSSFYIEDAEDMRASFAEEKSEIFTVVTVAQTLTSLWIKLPNGRSRSWFCFEHPEWQQFTPTLAAC